VPFDGSTYTGRYSIFGRELELALTGRLQEYMAKADEAILRAGRNALERIVLDGKDRLRGMVVKAGLGREGAGSGRGTGRSLAGAIRYDIYPKRGLAREPAALLYIQPSATPIYESFEEGATIRAGGGGFLTIPIPGSPASREVFGDKPRGTTILAQLKARGVEIAFVPGKGQRPAMLVANSVRVGTLKSGRTRVSSAKRTKTGGLASGTQSVPLFWLVPAAKMPKKFNLSDEFRKIERDFMREFAAQFAKELAAIEGATP
jgi:hypothetical protein